jgi:hypothetical protein
MRSSRPTRASGWPGVTLLLVLIAVLMAGASRPARASSSACAETLSSSLGDAYLIGEETTSTFTVAFWWPGWPVIELRDAWGYYMTPDGRLVRVFCGSWISG